MTSIRSLFFQSACLIFTLLGVGNLTAEESLPPSDLRVELEFIPPNPYETDPVLKDMEPTHTKHFFHLHGFPREKDLVFSFTRPIIKKTSVPCYERSFQINKKGIIEGLYPQQHPFIVITSAGFLPGEKVNVCIRSNDKTIHQEFTLIPHPMQAESSDGKLSIEAELLSYLFTTYRLHVKGLKEGERYTFESRSGGETIKESRVFQAENVITSMPGVVGKKGGNATVFIRNEAGSEASIKLPWGDQLIPFFEGKCYYPD